VLGWVDGQRSAVRLLNARALLSTPDFLAVTYMSSQAALSHKLAESALRSDVALLMPGHGSFANHLMSKFIFMQNFVRVLPESALVMFTDAWDVAFQGSPRQIVAAFESLRSPLVISAELAAFPEIRGTLVRAYKARFDRDAEWRAVRSKYANSGTYMGTAAAVGGFMDWVAYSNWTHGAHCRADYGTGEIDRGDQNHVSVGGGVGGLRRTALLSHPRAVAAGAGRPGVRPPLHPTQRP